MERRRRFRHRKNNNRWKTAAADTMVRKPHAHLGDGCTGSIGRGEGKIVVQFVKEGEGCMHRSLRPSRPIQSMTGGGGMLRVFASWAKKKRGGESYTLSFSGGIYVYASFSGAPSLNSVYSILLVRYALCIPSFTFFNTLPLSSPIDMFASIFSLWSSLFFLPRLPFLLCALYVSCTGPLLLFCFARHLFLPPFFFFLVR